jgi:RNA polymerase sigma-70 factor (ECF subfamily)
MVKEAALTAGTLDLHGYRPAAGTAARSASYTRTPAFDEVYGAHARFVWRVLRGMGVREAGIDDAVQDVFIVVHRRLPEFDGQSALSTWLFAIAYRVACDHRRKNKRLSTHDSLEDEAAQLPSGDALSPADSAEQAQRLRALNDALDQLDDEKRALIVLAELEEQTVPQIAALTGTSINTVYTRLRRARLELQALLNKRGSR